MLKRLWSIVACLGLSVALVAGCDTLEEDLDGGVYPDGEVFEDMGPSPDTGVIPTAEYRFVKITDLSDGTAAGTDGADIDAIELQKTAESFWATSVASCAWYEGTACADETAVLGVSDAFCGDPIDYGRCYSNYDSGEVPPYVALGGTVDTDSGELVVEMGGLIEEGDALVIYELGNCEVSSTCEDTSTVTAAPDSFSVSVGETATGPWVEILSASDTMDHPTVTVVVPALP